MGLYLLLSLAVLREYIHYKMLKKVDFKGGAHECTSFCKQRCSSLNCINIVQIYKVGHHGSKAASSMEFLKMVDADLGY